MTKQSPNNKFFWGVVRLVRPRQWIKNLAVFAGLIFSGALIDPNALIKVSLAFILFCGFSSATYILNDLFDIERDRSHPFKKRRPIASGDVSPIFAIFLAILLITISLPIAYIISPSLFLVALVYLIMQVLYSSYLKQVMLLDVMVIAAGFVLRIYAGVWIIDAHLNVWFLLSIISFALFIAIGKRRSELTLMQAHASKHRETLLHYPENLLDILTAMFANSTWLTYAFFAFLQPPTIAPQIVINLLGYLNVTFTQAKFLMVTVPIVIYGVMRYLYIIYEKKEGESPERVLLSDKPLLGTVTLWLLLVLIITYSLGA